jgi:hypothetical protein
LKNIGFGKMEKSLKIKEKPLKTYKNAKK